VLSVALISGGFPAASVSAVATHVTPNGWCTVVTPAGNCF
jgi:hypothetical protein